MSHQHGKVYDSESITHSTFSGMRHFSCKNVVLLDQLGQINYGSVHTAEAYDWAGDGYQQTVVAKVLSENADKKLTEIFKQEVKELAKLNHRNVVGVLAVCTDQDPQCVLLDAGKNRDLLTYIRCKKRQSFGIAAVNLELMQQIDDNLEMLHLADDICLGMCYMASLGIIHTDLSLRNCIFSFDGVAKVAGYGLSEQWYPNVYHKIGDRTYPIRWMAPEAIKTLTFTISSDTWSFGILIWELLTYGKLPYDELTDEDVVEYISNRSVFPARPVTCTKALYSIMTACWKQESGARLSFEQLHRQLQDLIVETQLEY